MPSPWRVRFVPAAEKQRSLFEGAPDLPEGMGYAPDLVSPAEEKKLLKELANLPFKEFEFYGFLGKRRTVSFGWRYEFKGGGELVKTEPMPSFLSPLRDKAARFAELSPAALEHALILEYG